MSKNTVWKQTRYTMCVHWRGLSQTIEGSNSLQNEGLYNFGCRGYVWIQVASVDFFTESLAHASQPQTIKSPKTTFNEISLFFSQILPPKQLDIWKKLKEGKTHFKQDRVDEEERDLVEAAKLIQAPF